MGAVSGRRAFLGSFAAAAITAAGPRALARPAVFPPPDRELMAPVRGGRIYVRINGRLDRGGPPIVMVHGGPGGTHAEFLDALSLADGQAVILYDQLDCGRSDRPDNPANWN